MTERVTIAPKWIPTFTTTLANAGYVSVWNAEIDLDPTEIPDDEIVPDETDPLPEVSDVKTDPVPEERP